MFNKLRGRHSFESSRTRRITGGKITTFNLGHPDFDDGIRWWLFPLLFCQNGLNIISCLVLQQKKKLMRARVSMLKLRASPDMLLSISVTRKDNSAHEQTPLSTDDIDSVLRDRELGRTKD
jgi:hypothetical protein